MKYDICRTTVSNCISGDQNDAMKDLFYTLCLRCINTCGECGQDRGEAKKKNRIWLQMLHLWTSKL